MTGHDRIALLRAIKKLIESLPQKPDELGFAGETEQQIAAYYERLGDEAAAGDWWVRAALQAEKYNQVDGAKIILDIAVARLPTHLGVRRELQRITAILDAAQSR